MIENKHSADSAAARSDEAMLISADDLAHLLGVSNGSLSDAHDRMLTVTKRTTNEADKEIRQTDKQW